MDKQLIYIAVGVTVFIILLVGVGFWQMGGGNQSKQIVNPELLKLEINKEKEKGN